MDKTTKVFDSWAKAGRAEEMEEGHGVTVGKFLGSISFDKPFSFLDIGCGNGWVVRKIAQLPKCKKAVGIDKSKNMIKRAVSKRASKKEKYACTDLESWNCINNNWSNNSWNHSNYQKKKEKILGFFPNYKQRTKFPFPFCPMFCVFDLLCSCLKTNFPEHLLPFSF